jgi:hypothetical protein
MLPEAADELVEQVPVGPAVGGEQRLLTGHEAREAVLNDRPEELGLAPEVVHHQRRADAGTLAHVRDRGALVAGLGKHLEGGRQDLGGAGLGAPAPPAAFLGSFGKTEGRFGQGRTIQDICLALQQAAQFSDAVPHRKGTSQIEPNLTYL